jgi:DNA-binding NarL/FixJ family response regulator
MIGRSCGSDRRIHVVVHAGTQLVRMGIRGLLAGVDKLDVTEIDTANTPSKADVLVWAIGAAAAASSRPANNIQLTFPRIVLLLERGDTRPTEHLSGATRGLLFSDCERDQLVRAIEAVSRGDYYLTADLEPSLTPAPSPEHSSVVAGLTEREHQVAQRLAEGHSNKKISTEMHVSLATVKFHVSNILRKLGVQTRAQAVAVLSRQFMHLEHAAPS